MKPCGVKRQYTSGSSHVRPLIRAQPKSCCKSGDCRHTCIPNSQQDEFVLESVATAKESPRENQKHNYQTERREAEESTSDLVCKGADAREAWIKPAINLNGLNAVSIKRQSDRTPAPTPTRARRKAREGEKHYDCENVNDDSD